ncbi:MAG: hypothetical protein H3C63_12515, partial [Candidatus Omnitrophica bacterium]|nr:hypothetical protein [Candidatus Omnitrophota bacterium]
MLCMITAILLCPIQPAPCQPSNAELAKAILDNQDFPVVMEKAKAILKTGFSAGEGYGEVWIRDLATFIEISCQVYDPAVIRENLLVFFHFQGEDGNIPDGFIPAEKASVSYEYILSNSQPTLRAHKNTVETDQESSLLPAVHRYIQRTGDATILEAEINGKPVLQRLEMALEFLFTKRFNDKYGLIWGATTADWGDVQPEHEWGVFLNDDSHLTLDIYDNAMAVIAITDFIAMAKDHPEKVEKWAAAKEKLSKNIRTHLWDAKNQKYIPHIYLDGSPFPADFNENEIYYHGGTAVAIQAGLLTPEEIQTSLETM